MLYTVTEFQIGNKIIGHDISTCPEATNNTIIQNTAEYLHENSAPKTNTLDRALFNELHEGFWPANGLDSTEEYVRSAVKMVYLGTATDIKMAKFIVEMAQNRKLNEEISESMKISKKYRVKQTNQLITVVDTFFDVTHGNVSILYTVDTQKGYRSRTEEEFLEKIEKGDFLVLN